MALANAVRFIWLDTYTDKDGEDDGFKRIFRTALNSTNTMAHDPIDSLIRSLNENVAPFLFAHTPDKAMELIKDNQDKRIIFISSGSHGQHIIPRITATYPYVYSFYFFSTIIENYSKFASEYRSCLQIFDNEIDLLVRLARDISDDIIKQGQVYLCLNEPKNALKCFQSVQALNITASTIGTLNSPFLEHLRILDSSHDNIGLIEQAKNMLEQQQS